jgi:hypothetical protein
VDREGLAPLRNEAGARRGGVAPAFYGAEDLARADDRDCESGGGNQDGNDHPDLKPLHRALRPLVVAQEGPPVDTSGDADPMGMRPSPRSHPSGSGSLAEEQVPTSSAWSES